MNFVESAAWVPQMSRRSWQAGRPASAGQRATAAATPGVGALHHIQTLVHQQQRTGSAARADRSRCGAWEHWCTAHTNSSKRSLLQCTTQQVERQPVPCMPVHPAWHGLHSNPRKEGVHLLSRSAHLHPHAVSLPLVCRQGRHHAGLGHLPQDVPAYRTRTGTINQQLTSLSSYVAGPPPAECTCIAEQSTREWASVTLKRDLGLAPAQTQMAAHGTGKQGQHWRKWRNRSPMASMQLALSASQLQQHPPSPAISLLNLLAQLPEHHHTKVEVEDGGCAARGRGGQ